MASSVLVWFKKELRLSDNSLLQFATDIRTALPVYVVDPRHWRTNALGMRRRNALQTLFLEESIIDLKQQFQELGSDLLVIHGYPEEIIPKLSLQYNLNEVWFTPDYTYEEQVLQNKLVKALWSYKIPTREIGERTLISKNQLPFPIPALPNNFTDFRKKVEAEHLKPVSLEPVNALPKLPESYQINSWKGFDKTLNQLSDYQIRIFTGGEKAAQQRLNWYLYETNFIASYKETRNQLLGTDFSSHLSPWLAWGCMSPRQIYAAVKQYEQDHQANESTYWLIFELLWRDFFHFTAQKHGAKIFLLNGFNGRGANSLKRSAMVFHSWIKGETGNAFIDANMRELLCTGYMSNRGRQNVASFLIHELELDWTLGAHYFESQLIDYDPCSNWCNWAYLAGVGNDPRGLRKFDIEKQARQYDADGSYREYWLGKKGA